MRRPTRLALASLILAAAPRAEGLDDPLRFFDDEVRVITASRRIERIAESPSAISVIGAGEIRDSAARTLPQLLQYVVGMDGYTKTHTDMDVAPRGYAYDETPKMLVLIDGQPVNVVPYGGMQWPTLPLTLEEIERIEVLRGPASAVYGADALVGVVQIITKAPQARRTLARALTGERGTRALEGHRAWLPGGAWSGALSAALTQTEKEGDSESDEAPAAAPNFGLKDAAKIGLATYRLDYDSPDIRFRASGGYSSSREGYNPSPGDRAIDRSRKETVYLNHALHKSVGEDELSLRLGFRNLSQRNERFNNGVYEYKYTVRKGEGLDADAQYTLRGVPGHVLVLGGNLSRLAASRDIANPSPYVYDESDLLLAGFAQDRVSLFRERLLLTVGARYDKWSTLPGQLTPRGAANLKLLDGKAGLRLAAATSFRRPAFDENHYFVALPAGGWFKGAALSATTADGRIIEGARLKPEKLTAYEAGLRLEPDAWTSVAAEYFHNTVTDEVGYQVFHSAGGALNLGFANTGSRTVTDGVELEAKRRWGLRWAGFLNYTKQYARITRAGATAAYLNAPKDKWSGGLTWRGWLTADVRFRYVSGVTYQEIPSVPVPAYFNLDAALSKRFWDRLDLKLAATNLLNARHYEYPIYTRIDRKTYLSAGLEF